MRLFVACAHARSCWPMADGQMRDLRRTRCANVERARSPVQQLPACARWADATQQHCPKPHLPITHTHLTAHAPHHDPTLPLLETNARCSAQRALAHPIGPRSAGQQAWHATRDARVRCGATWCRVCARHGLRCCAVRCANNELPSARASLCAVGSCNTVAPVVASKPAEELIRHRHRANCCRLITVTTIVTSFGPCARFQCLLGSLYTGLGGWSGFSPAWQVRE